MGHIWSCYWLISWIVLAALVSTVSSIAAVKTVVDKKGTNVRPISIFRLLFFLSINITRIFKIERKPSVCFRCRFEGLAEIKSTKD